MWFEFDVSIFQAVKDINEGSKRNYKSLRSKN